MKYIALIYCDEKKDAVRPDHEKEHEMAAYGAYTQEGQSKGVIKGGEALHPSTTATTVRVQDGKTLTADGPFTETKEHLCGYYVLDCENLDRAIEWAARIPHAVNGAIEVRPIMVFS
jgi:hypothetical protein